MRYLQETNQLFLHIPKTGGCAVEKVIDAKWQKMVPHKREGGPDRHVRRKDLCNFHWESGVSAFTVVRYPVDWYVSCFRHMHQIKNLRGKRRESRRDKGPTPFGSFDWHPLKWLNSILIPDFVEWINRIFNDRPGFLSKLFEEYIGFDEKTPCVDYVGRQETLGVDIKQLLGFEKMPTVGRSRTKKPHVPEDVVHGIMDTEKQAIDRYYGTDSIHFRHIKDWKS